MPPRFAYWTILIDNAPTAFRARDAEDLRPTLVQLKRTNENVALKWFARGRLWDSREDEHADFARRKAHRSDQRRPAQRDQSERRSKDWRPGGDHKDPRARFDKTKRRDAVRTAPPAPTGDQRPRDKPWKGKHQPGGQRWHAKPKQGRKPWQAKTRNWPKGKPRTKKTDVPEDE